MIFHANASTADADCYVFAAQRGGTVVTSCVNNDIRGIVDSIFKNNLKGCKIRENLVQDMISLFLFHIFVLSFIVKQHSLFLSLINDSNENPIRIIQHGDSR